MFANTYYRDYEKGLMFLGDMEMALRKTIFRYGRDCLAYDAINSCK